MADNITDPASQAGALGVLASALAHPGDTKEAAALFRRARRVTVFIGDSNIAFAMCVSISMESGTVLAAQLRVANPCANTQLDSQALQFSCLG